MILSTPKNVTEKKALQTVEKALISVIAAMKGYIIEATENSVAYVLSGTTLIQYKVADKYNFTITGAEPIYYNGLWVVPVDRKNTFVKLGRPTDTFTIEDYTGKGTTDKSISEVDYWLQSGKHLTDDLREKIVTTVQQENTDEHIELSGSDDGKDVKEIKSSADVVKDENQTNTTSYILPIALAGVALILL